MDKFLHFRHRLITRKWNEGLNIVLQFCFETSRHQHFCNVGDLSSCVFWPHWWNEIFLKLAMLKLCSVEHIVNDFLATSDYVGPNRIQLVCDVMVSGAVSPPVFLFIFFRFLTGRLFVSVLWRCDFLMWEKSLIHFSVTLPYFGWEFLSLSFWLTLRCKIALTMISVFKFSWQSLL